MGMFATTTSLDLKMIGTIFDSATTSLASASIYDADNEIKKALGKRYNFAAAPFLTTTTYPPILTSICETLAMGYMYENMSRGSAEGYARADRFIKRAMDNLAAIADGKMELLDASDSPVSAIDGTWAFKTSDAEDYEPTFQEDDPLNWGVDSDKLDDIESNRG